MISAVTLQGGPETMPQQSLRRNCIKRRPTVKIPSLTRNKAVNNDPTHHTCSALPCEILMSRGNAEKRLRCGGSLMTSLLQIYC